MQLFAPFLALSALVWGSLMWTWFKARSAAIKLWSFAGSVIVTLLMAAAVGAAGEGGQSVVQGLLG